MSSRYYDLFISHAWAYSERYTGIVDLLNSVPRFYWRNYSVPEHDPLVDPDTPIGKRTLTKLLDEQIRQASCFVLVAGMFVYSRDWIQTEINLARQYGKSIVGVRRRGQQRTPVEVEQVAGVMVNWNAQSIADGIRQVCR